MYNYYCVSSGQSLTSFLFHEQICNNMHTFLGSSPYSVHYSVSKDRDCGKNFLESTFNASTVCVQN